MAERRKRQRLSEDGDAVVTAVSEDQDHTSKRPRKETNASARRSLFIRSLPATATSDALTELFSQSYPLKHATVVLDPATKQSKGYGFVTFADSEDAQRALDEFNGQIFQGRKMKVEIAQPRSREVVPGDGMGGKRKSAISVEAAALKKAREEKISGDRKPPKLIVRNLPWSIKTSEQLEDLFRKFGKVKHATLPKVQDTQAGFGFIVMRGKKNAEKALAAVNGNLVDGRTLAVDWAVEKDIWEEQKKTTEFEADVESAEEESEAKNEEESENEDDDVAAFMKNFGDQLEDEEDSDAEKLNGEEWDDEENSEADENESEIEDTKSQKVMITDNSTTLFVRNLPFTALDHDLKEHFNQFGPVRYARVVMDHAMDRPKGTGFVCFFNVEDADACFRGAPRYQPTGANATKKAAGVVPQVKHSILQDENADQNGMYTIEGRILQIARAVDRGQASKLTEEGSKFRDGRDKDKRKLYLLSEGTVAAGTALYESLSPSEIKMREDSAMQRKKLIQNNPDLHISLTRLSIRNLPRKLDSKGLKALAREAVVGFATDVKAGKRAQLSKEEEARGGAEMQEAEKLRKQKGKGIVRQSKIVFEGREGTKVSEDSGAGRSRGYGFVEYSSHRWALMGLRWLNGHAVEGPNGKKQRLIVEFAIENASVVSRRKEREEKARTHSKEVFEARERGELPEKEKRVLSKDSLMAKTRKGTKGSGKGRPVAGKTKSLERVKRAEGKEQGVKRKGEDTRDWGKGARKPKISKEKDDGPLREIGSRPPQEDKLARKTSIIQKKRMMRRERRRGRT
ncbi:hypothetical protein B7494_g360 [Chlorociboria aeruginascens]|nr:hypothetical protein B7494_g360 [Chlorociboria aeruginascens]